MCLEFEKFIESMAEYSNVEQLAEIRKNNEQYSKRLEAEEQKKSAANLLISTGSLLKNKRDTRKLSTLNPLRNEAEVSSLFLTNAGNMLRRTQEVREGSQHT